MKTLAALLLPLALLSTPLAAHDDPMQRRSVSVSGEGEVMARPDRARLALAADAFNAELKTAEAQVNKVVRAYLAEVKALGIKDEHISTTSVTINPEYVWDEGARNNRLTGYRARRDIEVVVIDLDKLGDYLLRATKVGINHVQPAVLESTRATELKRQALVKATQDARAKAQLLADTLGVKLGAVHSIMAQDSFTPPPMPMPMKAMRMEAAQDSGNAEMGVTPGEIRFSSSVQADFDLTP